MDNDILIKWGKILFYIISIALIVLVFVGGTPKVSALVSSTPTGAQINGGNVTPQTLNIDGVTYYGTNNYGGYIYTYKWGYNTLGISGLSIVSFQIRINALDGVYQTPGVVMSDAITCMPMAEVGYGTSSNYTIPYMCITNLNSGTITMTTSSKGRINSALITRVLTTPLSLSSDTSNISSQLDTIIEQNGSIWTMETVINQNMYDKLTELISAINSNNGQLVSKIQEQIEEEKKTNQTIKEQGEKIDNTLKDDNVNTDNMESLFETRDNGVLSSILSLPLRILQTLVNTINNNTCKPLKFNLPFVDQEATIPCVSTLFTSIGFSTYWEILGGIFGALTLMYYLKYIGSAIDELLSLNEGKVINYIKWGGL